MPRQNRLNLLPCTARTSRERTCNQRVGCLMDVCPYNLTIHIIKQDLVQRGISKKNLFPLLSLIVEFDAYDHGIFVDHQLSLYPW